jgi:hypothetical protein
VFEGGVSGLAGLLRAALPSLPLVNQLPGIRKTGDGPEGLAFTRPKVAVDPQHVAAYARVCEFPRKETLPLTYPHMLAFPLHMAIMTSPDFPYPAIGTVHLENSIKATRPIGLHERLNVTVRTGPERAHAKGRMVDFHASVQSEDETVWESTSTYLRLGRGDDSAPAGLAVPEAPEATIQWQLPADLGRSYAAVSGDHNPIHLYPLTAKALGFPRQIAHGMWSLARCVAAVENRLPDAVQVDVAFKKPILLPGTVGFGQRRDGADLAFALANPRDGAPHLVGIATPA